MAFLAKPYIILSGYGAERNYLRFLNVNFDNTVLLSHHFTCIIEQPNQMERPQQWRNFSTSTFQ